MANFGQLFLDEGCWNGQQLVPERSAVGNTTITEDPRIDPRIKAVLGATDLGALSDAESREQVLEDATTEQVIAVRDLATRAAPWSLSSGAPEPVCRVTALDLAGVLTVTRRAVAATGCADRFDYASST